MALPNKMPNKKVKIIAKKFTFLLGFERILYRDIKI